MEVLMLQYTMILIATLAGASNLSSDLHMFSYDNQDQWPEICNRNETSRQSPVDINPELVIEERSLEPILFGNAWREPVSGMLVKNGNTLQFNPAGSVTPTVSQSGLHELVGLHMHWGRRRGEGSEHLIGGKQYEMEIQFVHTKFGSSRREHEDYYVILAVLAQVDDDAELTGIWKTLNVSQIVPNDTLMVNITDLSYSELIPESQYFQGTYDYYHYKGSLTTPHCDETVHWFIMKNPITVPGDFLRSVREIESDVSREKVTHNFREVQELGSRMVETPPTATGKSLTLTISPSVLCMFVLLHLLHAK